MSKLNEARALVDKLNSEAMEQSTLLAEKQAEADEALRLITTSMSVRHYTLNAFLLNYMVIFFSFDY